MTDQLTLWQRFEDLPAAEETGTVKAIPCGAAGEHLLVRGKNGEPTLLLASLPRTNPRAPIRLKHVSVSFDHRFEVNCGDTGSARVGTYCRLACAVESIHLYQFFVELMTAIANSHTLPLAQETCDNTIEDLIEIFRKSTAPVESSEIGLWGELLLIYLSKNPGSFVDAWRQLSTDTFDFSFRDARIEVKTTTYRTREHEFSLDQVRSGRGGDFVASLILKNASTGCTAFGLAQKISERLDGGRQLKLWKLVLEALGEEANNSGERRYDLEAATQSLSFIKACDVPSPELTAENNVFVTNVRFKSNINSACSTNPVNSVDLLARSL